MSSRFVTRLVGIALLGAAFTSDIGSAQPSGPQGDTLESIARLPDWSGAWVLSFDAFRIAQGQHRNPNSPNAPRWTPAYAAIDAELRRLAVGEGVGTASGALLNSEQCLPTGMPNVMRYAFAFEFLFTPGRVTILGEQDSAVRRIYTDGRKHSEDGEVSYLGESIGHWEGEMLVIETRWISPKAELIAGIRGSGETHLVERIFLKDADHLQIDTVIEDPVALAAPWRTTLVYDRIDPVFFERVCLDNNREPDGGEPDLTLPGD